MRNVFMSLCVVGAVNCAWRSSFMFRVFMSFGVTRGRAVMLFVVLLSRFDLLPSYPVFVTRRVMAEHCFDVSLVSVDVGMVAVQLRMPLVMVEYVFDFRFDSKEMQFHELLVVRQIQQLEFYYFRSTRMDIRANVVFSGPFG